MKKKIGIIFITLSMLFLCFSINNVKAQENNLDLVLVLDKSGSMNTADPNSLVKEAADLLVEMMPTQISRVGVIAFNRNQQVVSELTSLDSQSAVESLTDKIDSITYKGGTNLGDAVNKATTLFEDNDNAKGILVLSDGEDDFSSYEQDSKVASEEALADAITWAKNNNCKIYTLGFNYKGSMEEGSEGYTRLKNIADSTNGQMSSKTEASEIHEFFVDMLADLFGTVPQTVTNNKIEIKQYVKEANIYISSLDSTEIPDNSITLIDCDGNTVDLNGSDVRYYQSKYSAVIKLFNPKAGTWTIKTNFSGKVNIGYVALYQFNLSTKILDSNGEVTTITNGTTATISTTIMQDGNTVSDNSIYSDSSLSASATITPRSTKKSQTIHLTYSNGSLQGSVSFNELCVYDIVVNVSTNSFNLEDTLVIESTNSPIQLTGTTIDKQSVNKGKSITISNDELSKVVSDKEGDSYDYTVVSSDEDNATVEKTSDGIKINGKKWGSSRITVTFSDEQGNSVDTTFVVKVKDIVLMVFFGSLPFIAGAVVLLILYLIAKKSRMIKGHFSINKVTIKRGKEEYYINYFRSYKANVFLKRKKTLAVGMQKYANDIYNMETVNAENELLYQIFTSTHSTIREYLDEVHFIGTYLGQRGCVLKINKDNHVSLNNEHSYGKVVKKQMRNNGDFIVYVNDGTTTVCIEGSYSRVKAKKNNDDFDFTTGSGAPKASDNSDFDDFFD